MEMQTKTQPYKSDLPTKGNLIDRVQAFVSTRLIATIGTSLAFGLLLLGASGWNVWRNYQDSQTKIARNFKLQKLSDRSTYLDEVLTMSAYMGSSTGDVKWVERYKSYEPELLKVIDELIKLEPTIAADFAQTKTANDKLVEYETRSFELLNQGKRQDAANLLFGEDYKRQKQIYAQGVEKTLARVQAQIGREVQTQGQNLLLSLLGAGISIAFVSLVWGLALLSVKGYIRDRNHAQQSLLDSQSSLQNLNLSLEQQAQQLATQELAIGQENELLQADVSKLLDVVSAIEAGDLTVEAEISDRATGLVSDTLNRLIEELAKVMSTVLSTAQQVTKSADDLKQLSTTATTQVEQQTQSVAQVQTLMTNVTELIEGTLKQATVSEEATQDAQIAVNQGQQEIAAMARAIGFLQQNTEQIVRRSQLLADYVSLANQFSNDQKKVAAMTRVLALNASMVATRASDERDPEQFASIAREFETLAAQVNDLATQTNQSLIVLQQRTDQIQTVVSGVGQDVQDISSSVNQFTQNVDRSRQVFDIIKSVTERVAEAEQELAQSSQAIATAAQTTLNAVENIAVAATKTELQSRFTREQAEWMDKLAYSLLERVQFFRLPSSMVGSEMETEFLMAANDDTEPEANGTKPSSERTMPIEVLNGDVSYREWVTANQA
jgi:methyl-accepting chemotaxis protein PixJ